MSRFRMIVIAVITAAGLAIGAGPAIAAVTQNQVSHPASVASPAGQVMIPDSHCTRGGPEVVIYKAGCTDATSLNHGSCNAATGKMPFSPVYIFNGCGKRVWLFTGDLTGTKVCITGGTGNNNAFRPHYHYYQITRNSIKCP